MKDQPVIGVTGGVGPGWAPGSNSHKAYAGVVESRGANAVRLGHGRHGSFSDCDGLLIPGGWDVHPKYMKPLPGDENLTHEQTAAKYKIKTEKMRDEVEMNLIREAIAAGKPILGICRGFQILNVVVGGYLIGDILVWKPDALTHFANKETLVSESHEITIEPGSIMQSCYGPGPVRINSRHHQGLAPEFVSEEFRVTAVAPDGIVEAVELKGAAFIVGVQWHPEKQSDGYIHNISGRLFQTFVDACSDRRRAR